MENWNGLVVQATLTRASGTAERAAALVMLDRHKPSSRRVTLGADKAYDVASFVGARRERFVTPHVINDGRVSKNGVVRKTAVDGREVASASMRARRKWVKALFQW